MLTKLKNGLLILAGFSFALWQSFRAGKNKQLLNQKDDEIKKLEMERKIDTKNYQEYIQLWKKAYRKYKKMPEYTEEEWNARNCDNKSSKL